MSERKALSKKTRFEVFKRDKFTCQYCGKSAPDVILEVDHVVPVAEGGTDDMLNLVTACFDCNRGKGARELSDDAVIKRQKKQLDLLQERREQLEMMYKWQLDLASDDSVQLSMVESMIKEVSGYYPDEQALRTIRKHLEEFGFETVIEAVRIAFTRYEHETDDEWEHAFGKIGGICYYKTHKTCSQCLHDIGYDGYRHLVECEYDHDGSHWCKNSYAEHCDYFESRYGG